MKKNLLPFTILVLSFLLLFAPTAYGADALYHFMHNSHDALILGRVSSVEDGICAIDVSETIVSPINARNTAPARLLKPQTVKINMSDIIYYSHENRPPLLDDNVLISVDQVAEDMFTVANGAYLVDSLDKLNISVILAADAPGSHRPAAAAVECFMLSNAQISTYLFYEDIAVGYYLDKDHDYHKSAFIYYQGYAEATPRTPVPSGRLPHPGPAATFEVAAGKTAGQANLIPANTLPVMAQTAPMIQIAQTKPAMPPIIYVLITVVIGLTVVFIRQSRLRRGY